MKKKAMNVMANGGTELVFIIDRSGSMAGFEDDTIGGFNAMIEKQRSGEGRVCVSTVLFDSECEVLHDRIDINQVEPMNKRQYQVGGCTALLDAIGCAIHHIANVHKYARPDDVPQHTIFVITTDGCENASHQYSSSKTKEMIKRQSEQCGWEFIFLAANIDAIETADQIGIRRERAANYMQSREGYEACYASMNEFVEMKRRMHIAADDCTWKKRLEEDAPKS